MTHLSSSSHNILLDSSRLINVLERYHPKLPFIDEELACHQALRRELEIYLQAGEDTLAEWRQALAQRWECEVAGQRCYLKIQRQLRDYFGADSPQFQVIAPLHDTTPRSAADLLADLQRVEAALNLLHDWPLVTDTLAHLNRVCVRLEYALTQTSMCEKQRQNALLEQRLAYQAYQRARSQTQRLLAEYFGEQTLLELCESLD